MNDHCRLLLTGFEPFATFDVNPSWEAADAAARRFGPAVVAARLPVNHLAARAKLLDLLEVHRPTACLCMGLMPAEGFRLEILARKPEQFAEFPGDAVLHGHWPWEQLEADLSHADAPSTRSTDAGQYVCESTYWSLLERRQRTGHPTHAAFLHVPCVSPASPLERTVECVRAVVAGYLTMINAARSAIA